VFIDNAVLIVAFRKMNWLHGTWGIHLCLYLKCNEMWQPISESNLISIR